MGHSCNDAPEAVVSTINKHVKDKKIKKKMFKDIIKGFEMEDYDCLYELCDMDEQFKEVYDEMNPSMDDDWYDENFEDED